MLGSNELNLRLAEPDSGFFMKPFYSLLGNTNVTEWPFLALPGARSVRASYGHLEAQTEVPRPERELGGAFERERVGWNDQEWGVSAHIASDTIQPERSLLEVILCSYIVM